ncbi:MAG: cytochrome b [Alphaproteobacteria bacterium]|nr:cytochrome b [Alphaproteobacteria bacterium]
MPTEQLQYGPTAKAFHWVIAALIAIQLPLGWLMPDIHRGMTPGAAMTAHISIGMTILVLIVLRFLWRLTHPVAPETNLPAWQRVSSELVHWLLYVVVLLTTLSGWFFASARGWTIYLYGIVPLPRLVEENSPLGRGLGGWHATLTWILLGLVGIHIVAALVHLFIYRDRVMYRMLPGEPTV